MILVNLKNNQQRLERHLPQKRLLRALKKKNAKNHSEHEGFFMVKAWLKRTSSGDINNHIYHNSYKVLILIFRVLHFFNHYSHFHLRAQKGSAFHLHYKPFTCKTKNWPTFSLYQRHIYRK